MRYSVLEASADIVRAAGGQSINAMRHTRIVYAELSKEQVEKLKAQGYTVAPAAVTKAAVTGVEPPKPVAAEPIYTPYSLAYAMGIEDLRNLTSPPLTGEGFNIALLGTGVRRTHKLLEGAVVAWANYTNSPDGDGFDHDTGVASIIHVMVPSCGIIDYKVIADNGEGTEEMFVEAMDDIVDLVDTNDEYAPQVINLSLGTPDIGNSMEPMRVACREALNRGIWVFAAAGNSGPDPRTITSPACERYVMAVGSCGYEPFVVSTFSSRGPTEEGLVKPDAVMFGENIEVASSESDDATKPNSGTSFSAPFAAGAAVLFKHGEQIWAELEKPVGLPPVLEPVYFGELVLPLNQETVIDALLPYICVKPQGEVSGKDDDYGFGLPFAPLVTQYFYPGQVMAGALTTILMPMIMMMMLVPITQMTKQYSRERGNHG